MVSATFDQGSTCRFIIRPNQSLTWRQVQIFYLSMVGICAGIGTGFALLGFWPVLPFAGAELLVLGAALYLTALRTDRSEVVSVHPRTIAVERGRRMPEERWELPRAWTQVRLLRPRIGWYPSKLVLRAHGRDVEVGVFLTEEERRHLAQYLTRAIAAYPD